MIFEEGSDTSAFLSACSAVAPHGALRTQMETTLALLRSASEWIPRGFPGLTTISRVLRAKVTGFPPMTPADTTVAMSFGDAEANTSAGDPWVIWVASAPDEPKLNEISVPWCAALNIVPSFPKASVSDEAADTVIEPVSLYAVVVEVVDVSAEELPQAAMTAAANITAKGLTGRIPPLDPLMPAVPPSSRWST